MLRGKLFGQNLGDKARLYFIQRGDCEENWNVPIKIFRREAPEIPFCNDLAGMAFDKWYEYTANQSHLDLRVELIFEGLLPLVHSFNEYTDEDVKTGMTYIYWVEADSFDEHTILGPLGLKVRSRDVWWPYDKWVEEMNKIQSDYPDIVSIKQYGWSTMRRALPGMSIGNKDNAIALMGAVHASETGPELLLKAVRFMLESNFDLLNKIGVAVFPAVCVDVREETVNGVPHYQRLNHNGVDLNRNFDYFWREDFVYGMSNNMYGAETYHGPFPNSETEAEAAIAFLKDVTPNALFVYDNGSVITEDKMYYHGVPVDTDSFEYSTKLAYIYSKAFRTNNEGCGTFTADPITFPYDEAVFRNSGNPTGILDGWAARHFGIPAFNMQYAGSEEGKVSLTDDTTLELLNQWALRHAHALMEVMEDLLKNI